MSVPLAISDENGTSNQRDAGKDSREGGCEKGFSHQDPMSAALAISDENEVGR